MNPLTQVKNLQKITAREIASGISDDASWHAKYKDSAYVFIGGIPYDLTEGDLLAVFSQYGEVVDVNLVRDKSTGKSKGFAFLAYADQRSTVLAVDNLNGATVVGRTVRVDHVANYKRKKEEDEEEEQRKREERGVCYAFQKGECNRGASCKFSHDPERNANTGWGGKESGGRWQHDHFEKKFPGISGSELQSDKRHAKHRVREDNDSKEEYHKRHKNSMSNVEDRNRGYDENRASWRGHDEKRNYQELDREFTSRSRDGGRDNKTRRSRDYSSGDYERSRTNDRKEAEYYEQLRRDNYSSKYDHPRRHEEGKSREHSRRDIEVKERDGRRESKYSGSRDNRNDHKR